MGAPSLQSLPLVPGLSPAHVTLSTGSTPMASPNSQSHILSLTSSSRTWLLLSKKQTLVSPPLEAGQPWWLLRTW